MASGHGGVREGAGRKSLREKYGTKINRAEKVFADHLDQATANIKEIADGAQRIEEEWRPAGEIVIEIALMGEDGKPKLDSNGRVIKYKRLAYPDLAPDKMVLIRRKVVNLEPDREANTYIVDRMLGKPVAAVEAEVTGDGVGGAVLGAFADRLAQIYGDAKPDDSNAPADSGTAALAPGEESADSPLD